MDPETAKLIRKIFWPVYAPVPSQDVEERVDSILELYPEYCKLTKLRHSFSRIPEGYELHSKKKTHSTTGSNPNKEDDTDRSIRRTKATLRDYILCNFFDIFVTFTFGESHGNDERNIKQMNNWIKNQLKRVGKFEYIIVMERHKNGAIHFHALFKNYAGKIVRSYNAKTGRPIGIPNKPVYEIPGFTLGFTNVRYLEKDSANYGRACSYITKYISKDMPTFPNQNRYWASQKLLRPPKIDNPPLELLEQTPIWQKDTDNAQIFILPYPEQFTDWQDVQGFLDAVQDKSKSQRFMDSYPTQEGE